MSTDCPLCGGGRAKEIFRWPRPRRREPSGLPTESAYGRAGRIVRCETCGLVRQADVADAPYEDAADPEYASETAGLEQTAARNLDVIERYRRPPGRLLDVGCGTGVLLEVAAGRSWETIGVEPSEWAAGVARRRGLDVISGRLEDAALEPGSFDAVVLADVIEHVVDPLRVARRIERLLAPGGVLLICTPDIGSVAARVLRRWWWSVLPGHLVYFSRATLSRLLDDAGLVVVELRTHPKTFSVDYYAGRLTGYARGLGALARRGAAAVLGGDRLVTPDFRDRLAAVAVKP